MSAILFTDYIENTRLKKEIEKIENNEFNLKFRISDIIKNTKIYYGIDNYDSIRCRTNNKYFTGVQYSISIDFYDWFLLLDDYIHCEIVFWNNYPFRPPDCIINNKHYREVIFRNYGEIYKDKENYGIILMKYINYGFKECPCCSSLFYKNYNNFMNKLEDYIDEVRKVIILKKFQNKLKIARKIMLNKIGIEFESIYEYLVGVI